MLHIPEKLRNHTIIIVIANHYDQVSEKTHPDMAERIATKERYVHEIAHLIKQRAVPLVLAHVAPGNGLKAGFVRAIGEGSHPGFQLELQAIEHIASETGTSTNDLNLKWQIVRAYRNLHIRHPESQFVTASAEIVIPKLLNGADKSLITGIEDLKKKLEMV